MLTVEEESSRNDGLGGERWGGEGQGEVGWRGKGRVEWEGPVPWGCSHLTWALRIYRYHAE